MADTLYPAPSRELSDIRKRLARARPKLGMIQLYTGISSKAGEGALARMWDNPMQSRRGNQMRSGPELRVHPIILSRRDCGLIG